MKVSDTWNEMAMSIGMTTIDLWNRRKLMVPLLVLASLGAWVYHTQVGQSVLTFNLSVTVTVLLLIYLLIGTIVIDHIEWIGNLREVPSLVTNSLISIFLLMLILGYMGMFLMPSVHVPAPPLALLLPMLSAMKIAPWVTLAIVVPPIVGYFFKDRWRSLRAKYPFWGVYLGVIAAALTLYLPFMHFEMIRLSVAVFRVVAMGSILLILSGFLIMFPRAEHSKAIGALIIAFGPILWFGASGGIVFGSVLAVAGGGYAVSWEPRIGEEPAEEEEAIGREVEMELIEREPVEEELVEGLEKVPIEEEAEEKEPAEREELVEEEEPEEEPVEEEMEEEVEKGPFEEEPGRAREPSRTVEDVIAKDEKIGDKLKPILNGVRTDALLYAERRLEDIIEEEFKEEEAEEEEPAEQEEPKEDDAEEDPVEDPVVEDPEEELEKDPIEGEVPIEEEVEEGPDPRWEPGDKAKTEEGKVVEIEGRRWDTFWEEWVYDCKEVD